MALITLRMDDELSLEIEKLTKTLKKTKSEVIRECVQKFIQNLKKQPQKTAYQKYLSLYSEIPKKASDAPDILSYLKKKKSEGRL